MGTSFVTITDGTAGTEPGFWMRDEMLELWLFDGVAHVDLYKASPEEYKTRVVGFLNHHMRMNP